MAQRAATLHRDMNAEVTNRICSYDSTVISVERPCREHVRIEMKVTSFPASVPGMFLQIQCNVPDHGEARSDVWPLHEFPKLIDTSWAGREPYIRRPFSIADRFCHADGSEILVVISRAVGPGTRFLDQLSPGRMLNITGPLGRGFKLPEDDRPLLLVGGGVGIPPLLYVIRTLNENSRRRTVAVFGATSGDLLPVSACAIPSDRGVPSECLKLPGGSDCRVVVTSDDGSMGLPGRVTGAVELLSTTEYASGARPLVLACGPERMLAAVATQTRRLGWDCQLCIEKNMGCGLGTCLSCVTKVVDRQKPAGWRWALACSEGPVFERDRLLEFAAAESNECSPA